MRKIIFIISVAFISIVANAQTKSETTKMIHSKFFLSQKAAKQITELAEQEALKNNWKVSIAIVNEFGQLIHFTKMDDATNSSVDISLAKAKHAAYYKRDTKFHHELLEKGNNVVLALPNSLPIEGGVQLMYNGKMIGAIGVSGAASEDDGKIAKVGADFVGSLD